MSPSVATLGELLWLMNEGLVLEAEPIDWGHDATLNQSNLALDPEARIQRQTSWARGIGKIRGVQPEPEFDPVPILVRFADGGVDFVVIGGVAGGSYGSAYPTYDVDVAYSRAADNLERLAATLVDVGATLRGAPADVPFILDAKSLYAGGNFTFATELGNIDVPAYPAGAPAYEKLRADAKEITVEGRLVRVASIDHLIAMKEAAGRPKDKLMASELRVISDLLRAPKPDTVE